MAAHISLCSHLTSHIIFLPLQISQQCRLPRRNSAKILNKTAETPRNRIDNSHFLQANTFVCTTKLGNATTLDRKSNIYNPAKAILKPKSALKYETKREEEKEDMEYYTPKMGDLVVGVVVSCNENRLEIGIGSEKPASMYLSEFLPINQSEIAQISCELPATINIEGISESSSSSSAAAAGDDYCDRFANGRMGILMNKSAATKPVIEDGTVIYAEVLGRAFNGEALLSSRRFARKIAWQRLRQIKHINKPIEIAISEWNTGGLISRIEGLRGFLPKCEILNTPLDNFSVLKEYVGTRMEVVIVDVNEEGGVLVVSEKRAWEMRNLYEGNLLQGTIKKLYPYGAQVMVDGTGISGLLHISNMSCEKVSSVTDLFSKGEKVKVMVVHSNLPNKRSFSTANLESENGLILSNKERVFKEAEQIAAAYRSKFGCMHEMEAGVDDLDIHDNTNKCYANWDWLNN